MYDYIKNKLVENGLKVTMQRLAVFEALLETDEHPTVDYLISKIGEKYPTISVGTIYKTLDTLVNRNLIKRVKTDGDKMRYDAVLDWHHHLYCTDTQKIADYHDEELNQMLEQYFKRKNIPNFKIEDINLQISGHYLRAKDAEK